jgi:hypothetical protein
MTVRWGSCGKKHVEVDLLDGVGKGGAGEHQVLEGPGKTPEVSRTSNKRPGCSRGVGLHVLWRRNQLAVHQAISLKNIESKLTLSEEEPVCLMLYKDSQKMMEGPEIFHG